MHALVRAYQYIHTVSHLCCRHMSTRRTVGTAQNADYEYDKHEMQPSAILAHSNVTCLHKADNQKHTQKKASIGKPRRCCPSAQLNTRLPHSSPTHCSGRALENTYASPVQRVVDLSHQLLLNVVRLEREWNGWAITIARRTTNNTDNIVTSFPFVHCSPQSLRACLVKLRHAVACGAGSVSSANLNFVSNPE